jgi:hypothetical protein
MKTITVLLTPIWVFLLPLGFTIPPANNWDHRKMQQEKTSHRQWSSLLAKHVDEKGLVNYRGFLKDSTALGNYLKQLALNAPAEAADRDEKLVYYINLYNAATVKLILDHYPLKSIKDIDKPWDHEWVRVGNKKLSLGQIEHNILRKMKEPRIHFAINCASYSCPKLWNKAFTIHDLDNQLDMATRDFIRDPTRNKITKESLELSRIFQWYKKDFSEEGSLLSYISPYTEVKPNPDARITYSNYDWSLNEAR